MPKGQFNKKEFVRNLMAKLPAGRPIVAKLRYSKEVAAFIRKLDEAHGRAGKSKLRFGDPAGQAACS